MKNRTTLSSRFALMIFGRVLILLVGLLITAILTRHLGPTGFGSYRTAVAYLSLAVVFADLGLGSIFVREISRHGVDQARIIGNALSLRLLLAFVIMLVAVLLSYLLPFDGSERLGILAGSLGFVAYSLHLLLFGLFQQKLRQQGVILAEVTGGLVLVTLVVGLSYVDAEPFWFVGSLGFSYILTLIGTVFFAKRLVPYKLRMEMTQWRVLIRAGLPLAGAGTLGVLYVRGDSVLLALLHSPEAVGLYGVPIKISDSALGIALLFIGLFAPLLARSALADTDKFIRLVNDSFGVIFLGGVGGAVMLNVLAVDIIQLLAGSAFIDGVLILRLLSVFMVLHAGTLMLREATIALNMQSKLLAGYMVTLGIALLAYFYLIPPYSGVGAAAALIISELFLLSFVLKVVANGISQPVSLRVPVLGIISGVSTVIIFDFIILSEWHWLVRLMVSVTVYIVMLLASRALRLSQIKSLVHESIGSIRK
ncbi:MAG: oligosaccharide flippase family protein [Proteobacteria bacterium]|nr:oligosaccharide flippase family protein [Pseudomonadota bacterium]